MWQAHPSTGGDHDDKDTEDAEDTRDDQRRNRRRMPAGAVALVGSAGGNGEDRGNGFTPRNGATEKDLHK